jgi:hypothetical protein
MVTDPDGSSTPPTGRAVLGQRARVVEDRAAAVEMIRRRNLLTGDWDTRYRGFIEEMNHQFDPSQKFNRRRSRRSTSSRS